MKANTLVMMLLAVVFGVIAVFLTNIWLDGRQPTAAAVSDNVIAQEMVVVAAVPLRFGDRLTQENLREIPWPSASLPVGAFKTREDLLSAIEGERQVLTAIEPNEPVLNWKITGPGQRATLSAVLAEGKKAVSIRVNDVLGVAGFVLPGDRVDILLTRSQSRDRSSDAFVDVLLQGVKVLAIDQLADERNEDPTVVKAVTLEVDTLQAQKLTLAAGIGQLSLALREVASGAGEITQRVTINDLVGDIPDEFAAEPGAVSEKVAETTGAELQPQADSLELEVKKPLLPRNAQVIVTRGVERKTYDVPFGR